MENNRMHQKRSIPSISNVSYMIYGIGFTFMVSALGYGLAAVPGFNRIGPMACAILLAVLYRHFIGYPDRLRSGIQFSSRQLLRFAIILYGLKLNIGVIVDQGLALLAWDALVIVFAILMMVWIGKWLKADPVITFLLGAGTGICGAAAIAVVSSIIKSKEEDTAMSVGMIALMGTIFSVAYTIIRPLLPLSPVEYGMWSGLSLHEIAHVALAGAPAGQEGLAMALVAKLGRVLLLVPLAFILIFLMKRKNRNGNKSDDRNEFVDRSKSIDKKQSDDRYQSIDSNQSIDANIVFPWFLIGFIVMSILGSYVFGKSVILPEQLTDGISSATTFLMTSAMAGLGLNISLRDIRQKAAVPIGILFVTSIALSLWTYMVV